MSSRTNWLFACSQSRKEIPASARPAPGRSLPLRDERRTESGRPGAEKRGLLPRPGDLRAGGGAGLPGTNPTVDLSRRPSEAGAAARAFDPAAAAEDVVHVAVQIGGKLRGEVEVERGASEETALDLAKAHEKVARHLEGRTIVRVIFVPDRLINIVVK